MARDEKAPVVSNEVGYFGEFKVIERKDAKGEVRKDKNGNPLQFGLLSIDLPNGNRKTLGVSGSIAVNDCIRKQAGDVVNVSFETTIKGQTTYYDNVKKDNEPHESSGDYVTEIFGSSVNALNASNKISLDDAQKRIEKASPESRDAIARLMERAI